MSEDIQFHVEDYVNDYGNLCHRFVVTNDRGRTLYTCDYGSTGGTIQSYIYDYYRYINGSLCVSTTN